MYTLSLRSSIGWAGSWSDLGCKFKSYLEHTVKVVMELVDMNSLGLFDIFILSVQVGFTLLYF